MLFLKSSGTPGENLPDIFGLNQGVFRVKVDQRTGQRMVVPPPVIAAESSAPAGAEAQPVKRGSFDRRPLAFDYRTGFFPSGDATSRTPPGHSPGELERCLPTLATGRR